MNHVAVKTRTRTRDAPLSQTPLVILMVAYTMAGLAQLG